MKNRKGFTLVELLAALTILAIISTIAVVSVDKILNRADDESSSIQEELIEDAAKQYASDINHISNCSDDDGCTVSIQQLINDGYLEDNDNLNKTTEITIKNENKKFIIEQVATDETGEN